MILAEVARLEAVVMQDNNYARVVLKNIMDQSKEAYEGGSISTDEAKLTELETYEMALHRLRSKMVRFGVRLFLVGMLQNGLQASLQISLMALQQDIASSVDASLSFST